MTPRRARFRKITTVATALRIDKQQTKADEPMNESAAKIRSAISVSNEACADANEIAALLEKDGREATADEARNMRAAFQQVVELLPDPNG